MSGSFTSSFSCSVVCCTCCALVRASCSSRTALQRTSHAVTVDSEARRMHLVQLRALRVVRERLRQLLPAARAVFSLTRSWGVGLLGDVGIHLYKSTRRDVRTPTPGCLDRNPFDERGWGFIRAAARDRLVHRANEVRDPLLVLLYGDGSRYLTVPCLRAPWDSGSAAGPESTFRSCPPLGCRPRRRSPHPPRGAQRWS